jgi:DNA repair protein RadC
MARRSTVDLGVLPERRDSRRDRLSIRALQVGPSALGDVELMALVGHLPLADAAVTLERLGGVAEAAGATPHELIDAGVAPSAAVRASAVVELVRRGAARLPADRWQIRTPADLAIRLMPVMGPLEREELRVALLNTKNVVTGVVTVYVGNLAGSSVRVAEVFRDAIRRNAAAIVVAHNHPSGDPAPSSEDLRITAELAAAGRLLDVELLDHLVITRDAWISLRALGAL